MICLFYFKPGAITLLFIQLWYVRKHVRWLCEKQLLSYCIEILKNGIFTFDIRKKGCFCNLKEVLFLLYRKTDFFPLFLVIIALVILLPVVRSSLQPFLGNYFFRNLKICLLSKIKTRKRSLSALTIRTPFFDA